MAEEPIRIAYLIAQYPTISHTFIFREIKRLRALGFEIHVASISAPDRPVGQLTPDEREEMARTFYVKRLGPLRAVLQHLATFASRPVQYCKGLLYAIRLGGSDLRKIFFCLLYFAEAVIVGRWMKGQGLAHVHVHFSSTVGLIATRVFPITLSCTIHGSDEFMDPAGFWLSEKVAASSFVFAISNYGRSQLMRASNHRQWNKLAVVPLGIDSAAFAARPFRENPAPFQIFFIGRLAPVKGLPILIAAVDRLVKQGRDVQLRLVGDGPERPVLEEEVRRRGLDGRVVFEGRVDSERVPVLCNDADAFAMSSFAEGVPVAAMEAMAMAIPCVAPKITGIPELIQDGTDGLLFTSSNDEELAQALATLVDNPALRQRLGEAGRKRILEKYDLDRNTAHLADLFREKLKALRAGQAQRAPVPHDE